MKIIVTGGAGFIGSALVKYLLRNTGSHILNIDKLSYAGDLDTLGEVSCHPRYSFQQTDICNQAGIQRAFDDFRPNAVMHLAAESHVDRSIAGPAEFIRTNITGTYNLLNSALNHWQGLSYPEKKRFRFHHVSTDEVYGALGSEGLFTETTPYAPNSPYSASKASSDHLVRAWFRTYGLPTLVTNCSNNYGPYQHPEKLIPKMILNATRERPLPVYGDGEHIRDWLHVSDHVRALERVLRKGEPGENYHIGGATEIKNIEVVRTICKILDEMAPVKKQAVTSYADLITFVEDRPGHDFRYALDTGKITKQLGWAPEETFETGIRKTIEWYLTHPDWCKSKTETTTGKKR